MINKILRKLLLVIVVMQMPLYVYSQIDYGCWGTITVYIGEQVTLHEKFSNMTSFSSSKVRGWSWSTKENMSEDVGWYSEIISQSNGSCVVKGRLNSKGDSDKIYCKLKYGSYNNVVEYIAYYNVIVKSRGTTTVSASPSGGTVSEGTKVTITPSVSGSTIYYTTNGDIPRTNSNVYSPASGVIIDKSMTLKARAVKDGYESEVGTWDYKVTPAIEINATNFPDDNFRNYLLDLAYLGINGFMYYGKDGKFTEDEIKSITSLRVSEKSIRSLQGIEHFTALKYLYCGDNQLTALDVSKNTALTELYCYGNQLTALDVSKNTALTELYCYGNQLTALDVSKNTALTKLKCNGNQLMALDVSGCTALTSLDCSYNGQLTILNVSGCTALTSLDCRVNQLMTSLDVSKNTALEYLYCQDNQLTSLDVSGCTALHWLLCYNNQLTALDVSGCTALTELYCYNNLLTALDVSGCTTLYRLFCYNNLLTSLDVSNTALKLLRCCVNKIKGASMDNLISSLPTQEEAKLYVYSSFSSNEGNVCTKEQVQDAKKKGWTVRYGYKNDYDSTKWEEYEGSDDTSAIDDIMTETGEDVPIYNLRGQRLTAPQKGVNIIGGRKVVVK